MMSQYTVRIVKVLKMIKMVWPDETIKVITVMKTMRLDKMKISFMKLRTSATLPPTSARTNSKFHSNLDKVIALFAL